MSKTETFPLNQKLICVNYGIYVATCVICHEQYAGQTKNKFSKRWSSHRSNWNRPNCEIDENYKDKVALLRHYSLFHGNVNKPPIYEACTVTFVEESNFLRLNFCENNWYHKLKTQINIQNMIFHAWDKFCFPCAQRWCVSDFCRKCEGVSVFVSGSISYSPAEAWLP